jgi:hypothetical protein
MRAKELGRLWVATIRIKNPQYTGYVDVQAWAPNANVARQIIKNQYNIQDLHISNIKEVK